MRIERATDSTLFQYYDIAKQYVKGSKVHKTELAERILKSNDVSSSQYAKRYCEMNGFPMDDDAEMKQRFLEYNIKINDMLYRIPLKVEYVAQSFIDALNENYIKILDSAKNETYYNLLGECSGYMIIGNILTYYAIREDGTFIAMDYRDGIGKGYQMFFFNQSENLTSENVAELDSAPEMVRATYLTLSILLFKRFGEIETLYVGAGAKRTIPNNNDVMLNRAPFAISILDSTWLTTIVRTEGFLVRGHFRLQPYGEGRSMRKLIYIQPFEKHGYTRRAGKLIAEES